MPEHETYVVGGVGLSRADVCELQGMFNHGGYKVYTRLLREQIDDVVDATLGDHNQHNVNVIFQCQGAYLMANTQKSWPIETKNAFDMIAEKRTDDSAITSNPNA